MLWCNDAGEMTSSILVVSMCSNSKQNSSRSWKTSIQNRIEIIAIILMDLNVMIYFPLAVEEINKLLCELLILYILGIIITRHRYANICI